MQPDKGWAWVVLGATMGSNFLMGVLVYFVGVIHTGLLQEFKASVTTTAWVGALYSSMMCLSAPLASIVIKRYGCRVCCVLGGLVTFTGFTASAFVKTMALLFLTYGFVTGIGLGLAFSPTIITIGYYFDKFRGMASGLSVCLAAVGILCGSLIAQTLIDEYSVRGAFLLIAALSLHYSFFGMFFRPTPYEKQDMNVSDAQDDVDHEWEKKASKISLALHGVEIVSLRSTSLNSVHRNEQFSGRPGYGSVTSLLRKAQLNRRRMSLENASLAASLQSAEFISKNKIPNSSLSVLVRSGDSASVKLNESTATDRPHTNHIPREKIDHSLENVNGSCDKDNLDSNSLISSSDQNLHNDVHNESEHSRHDKISQNRTDSECTRENMTSETQNDVTHCDDDTGSHLLPQIQISRVFDDDSHSMTSRDMTKQYRITKESQGRKKTKMLNMMDAYIQVLTNKAFMFHSFAVLAANLHVSGVYLHLPEYVQSKGTNPTQAAALFIAVGVMSLLSRLAAGFATTDPKVDPLTLHMGMMGLCGIFTIFFPFYADTYAGQLAFSGLFGLYTGGQFALMSVLTVQFAGVSLLSTAFGVLVFLMGVGYVTGPPLAALIVDSGWSYKHSFIFLGCVMLFGSFLNMAAGYFSQSQDPDDDVNVEIASVNRDWLGGSLIISIQEADSAHVNFDHGSAMSVHSRCSQDLKV